MLRIILVACVCFCIFAPSKCAVLGRHFENGTITEQPEQLNTNTPGNGGERFPSGYYTLNNIPKLVESCNTTYVCKKKLMRAESPKPCVKYCVKSIQCQDVVTPGEPNQCVEFNEEMVAREYNDCKKDEDENITNKSVMYVALIDFPCQAGYMPDSRGRCREVW